MPKWKLFRVHISTIFSANIDLTHLHFYEKYLKIFPRIVFMERSPKGFSGKQNCSAARLHLKRYPNLILM